MVLVMTYISSPFSRRAFVLGSGAAAVAGLALPAHARAAASAGSLDGPGASVIAAARSALARHADHIDHADVIGIADFSRHSSRPRFFLYEPDTGHALPLLVAHGRGSDPAHTGWLQRFSPDPGSLASSAGAFLTGDAYVGSHGKSRRLLGLDPENATAEARAIVIHGAWYVSPDVVAQQGKIGRSEGCFAFSPADIATVLERLGPGRLLFSTRV